MPLCQYDMEPTSYPVGGHDLRDIIVGLNQMQGRGGGVSYTDGALGNMASH